MLSFLIRRLLQGIFVFIVLSFLCFYLMSLMPGDPIDLLMSSNPEFTAQDRQRLIELYGLNQPVSVRYKNWALEFLQGNLGYSRTYRVPVSQILAPRLFNTFLLAFCSLTIALIVAIPLGVYSAVKERTPIDYAINLGAFAGISVPSFWLGIQLILLFSVRLNWLPAGGTTSIGSESLAWSDQIIDRIRYLALPTLTLSVIQTGGFVRYIRSSMVEALHQDYVRTARAKGMSLSRVIWIHAFRNSALPLITVVSLAIASSFSGAIITENIFAYQGAGKLTFDSIVSNDFNVAMVTFTISVAAILFFNFLADVLYCVVDPRVSYR